jgi:uncharacterized protein YecE (DUF72 family)
MSKNPQSASEIKIGTSGFSYDDWRGVFYPQEIPSAKMLEFYALHFQAVEINVTYYTIPGLQTFSRLAEKTPADFEFIVKTNQETTHRRKENESALKKLLSSIQPLTETGKFHGFLAQFPYSFKNNEENRRYLNEIKKYIGDQPLFVEFRNYTWINSEVPKFLEENNIGYVNVDQPKLRGLLPAQDLVTNETGYIRFHGRNGKEWWEGKGSARYDYEYNQEELKEWLINISNILRKTYKTYIYFNNHPTGKAVKNAQQMMEILKKAMILK